MTTVSPALDERVIPVPAIAGISSDAALVAVWAAAASVPAGGVFPTGCLAAVQAAMDGGVAWRLTGMSLLAAGEAAAAAVDGDKEWHTCQRPWPGTLAYGLGSSEVIIAGQAVVIRGEGSAPARVAAARAAIRWLQGLGRDLGLRDYILAETAGVERISEDPEPCADDDTDAPPPERHGRYSYDEAAE